MSNAKPQVSGLVPITAVLQWVVGGLLTVIGLFARSDGQANAGNVFLLIIGIGMILTGCLLWRIHTDNMKEDPADNDQHTMAL